MNDNIEIIKKLMLEHDTSFYVYDENIIAHKVNALKQNFPGFEFLYSVKTNPYEPIVNYMVSQGFGADVASSEEVLIGQNAGLSHENVLYSTPGKTRKDIEKTIEKCIIIADSYNELLLINQVAKQRNIYIKVGLRINPNFSMGGGGSVSSKFGVDENTLHGNEELFHELTNIEISGIHVHLRSQVLNQEDLYEYYKYVFNLAVYCIKEFRWNLEFINFGGGLGIAYSLENDSPLDIKNLGYKCKKLIEKFKKQINARLFIETGRYVICEAGFYVTRIADIKESMGVKYLIVEKGLNGFLRPSISELLASVTETKSGKSFEPLYTCRDAYEFLIPEGDNSHPEKVSIVGSLCTATDIMAKDIYLPKADIGNLIIVTKAGSYSYSLTPLLFASHSIPLQFYINKSGKINEH